MSLVRNTLPDPSSFTERPREARGRNGTGGPVAPGFRSDLPSCHSPERPPDIAGSFSELTWLFLPRISHPPSVLRTHAGRRAGRQGRLCSRGRRLEGASSRRPGAAGGEEAAVPPGPRVRAIRGQRLSGRTPRAPAPPPDSESSPSQKHPASTGSGAGDRPWSSLEAE